jgi:hypothetical protein
VPPEPPLAPPDPAEPAPPPVVVAPPAPLAAPPDPLVEVEPAAPEVVLPLAPLVPVVPVGAGPLLVSSLQWTARRTPKPKAKIVVCRRMRGA